MTQLPSSAPAHAQTHAPSAISLATDCENAPSLKNTSALAMQHFATVGFTSPMENQFPTTAPVEDSRLLSTHSSWRALLHHQFPLPRRLLLFTKLLNRT